MTSHDKHSKSSLLECFETDRQLRGNKYELEILASTDHLVNNVEMSKDRMNLRASIPSSHSLNVVPNAEIVFEMICTDALQAKLIESTLMESEDLFLDLVHLREPFTFSSMHKTVLSFLKIIPPSLIIGLNWIGWCILTTLGFMACNKAGDPLLTSTLSMTIFFNTMTFMAMNYASTEKAGIAMSQAYGARNYAKFKKYFCQSLLLGLLYGVIVGIPLIVYIKDILIVLQIMPKIAENIQGFYWKFALTELIKLAVDLIMVFVSSQGIETTFFGLMITNTLLSGTLMVFLCFYLDFVLDGLILSLLMFHCFNLAIFIKIYLTECNPKTRGLVRLSEVLHGFKAYVSEWLRYFVGIWIEYFAWEVSNYFVALTNDINQVAAFGSLVNVAYLNCTIQVGIKIAGRNRINYLIAKGYIDAARRCFCMMFAGIICLNIPIGLSIYIYRHQIANFYAGNINDARDYLIDLLAIYCIGMSAEPLYGLLSSTARIIDHVGYSIMLNVVFIIGVMGSTHYIIVKVLNLSVVWLVMNMYCTFAIVYGMMFAKFALYDWHRAPVNSK